MNTGKVWFVTGASKGLGLSLVKQLLESGYRVAATSRDEQALINAAGSAAASFLPIKMDIANNADVKQAIEKTVQQFGRIDVVVNNAGYGQMGALEELTDEEARKNFDVNVFGALNVIRNAMPYLRKQGAGHIFNISSIGGLNGTFGGWGIYCATKFAMAGFTESLADEVKSFGVHVTLVYPGYFRTDFLSNESAMGAKNPIADYDTARQTELLHRNDINGNQPGDPLKAANVMIAVSEDENPPLHLVLGKDAYSLAEQKILAVQQDMAAQKDRGTSTDF
ncbi:MAG: SDR family NAD(P)-dependent oxidoreductase [Filimonas sp.]|nr:SDR family NAD(P)-dependent oxidoreductase [Filimonas sp.]